MPDVVVTYDGANIVELSEAGTKTLKTAGKYLTDDVVLAYSGGSGGGGSIALASVTLPYSTTYYTDATMKPQTGDGGSFNVQMLVGSICVGRGAADPGTPISGVTLMASWGSRTTAVHVYKVTG